MVLVDRDWINLLQSIIDDYLKLVCGLASIKMIEVSTAFPFTNEQKNMLIKIRFITTVDSGETKWQWVLLISRNWKHSYKITAVLFFINLNYLIDKEIKCSKFHC